MKIHSETSQMAFMSASPTRDDATRPIGQHALTDQVVKLEHLELRVSPHMDRHTAETLLGMRPLEQTEYGLAAEIIRPGQTVVDIGAGSAAWSLWVASLGARVETFEPSPLLCPVAQANLDANRCLPVEFHSRWAVVPSHQGGPVNLALPGHGYDAACVERYPRAGDPDVVPVPWLESAERLVRRIRPDAVFVETSGMACEIAMAIASVRHDRPRTLIARLRPDLEGEQSIRSAVEAIRGLGYSLRLDMPTMLWDGWIFEC